MLWQYTSSLACTSLVFQGQPSHDFCQRSSIFNSKPLPFSSSSELLSITVSFQPRRLQRTKNDSIHFMFRKKRILSPQYLSFPFLPSNRPKANINFVKQSSFPFRVMKRHHLVDVALKRKASPTGRKKTQYSQFPVLSMGASKVCIMKKLPLNNKYQSMFHLTKHST